MYFAGARVAGVIPWVPAAGSIGLGVSIFSYTGRVTLGLRVDAGLISDPEAIIDAFEDELKQLGRLRVHPKSTPHRPAAERAARPAADAARR